MKLNTAYNILTKQRCNVHLISDITWRHSPCFYFFGGGPFLRFMYDDVNENLQWKKMLKKPYKEKSSGAYRYKAICRYMFS